MNVITLEKPILATFMLFLGIIVSLKSYNYAQKKMKFIDLKNKPQETLKYAVIWSFIFWLGILLTTHNALAYLFFCLFGPYLALNRQKNNYPREK